jgi:hypothetical protein
MQSCAKRNENRNFGKKEEKMDAYDDWKLSSPCDMDYDSPTEFGYIHEDDLPSFEDTRAFLRGAIEALYETANVSKLEGMLEELCFQFDVKFPRKEVLVEPKLRGSLMDWYLTYQKDHLKKIANGEEVL